MKKTILMKNKNNSDIFEHNYNPEVRDNYKKKLK